MNGLPTQGPIGVEVMEDDAYWRVVLGGSKGNILDMAMIQALTDVFRQAGEASALKAIEIKGQGAHFSFGASVAEHLPEQVGQMLPRFHQLFHAILASSVTTLAAVRGQCLGGGLELASFCHRVFASSDAKLGQPEIVLGVLAPVASVILTERIGRARAEDLCLSGRVVSAEEAHQMGLVDEIAEDPSDAALRYAREHILPHSAASLRYAVRAVRCGLQSRLETELAVVERLYLDGLMSTQDAVEGLRSFMEKRKPQWKNR